MSNITSLQIGQKTLNIGKSVLLKSFTDNNGNYCRVYSDGWCEQGGIVTIPQFTQNTDLRIDFIIPYKDNKYSSVENIGSNGTN